MRRDWFVIAVDVNHLINLTRGVRISGERIGMEKYWSLIEPNMKRAWYMN